MIVENSQIKISVSRNFFLIRRQKFPDMHYFLSPLRFISMTDKK